MEQVIPLYNNDVLAVTQNLKTYLEGTFDFVYNHNDFFVVANNDTPLNSLPNTTGETIWLKMIDYVKDNHFTELKDAEILREKLQSMDQVTNYVGEYFSKEWVMRNVLLLNDEDIDKMKDEIAQEMNDGEIRQDDEQQQDNGDQ